MPTLSTAGLGKPTRQPGTAGTHGNQAAWHSRKVHAWQADLIVKSTVTVI